MQTSADDDATEALEEALAERMAHFADVGLLNVADARLAADHLIALTVLLAYNAQPVPSRADPDRIHRIMMVLTPSCAPSRPGDPTDRRTAQQKWTATVFAESRTAEASDDPKKPASTAVGQPAAEPPRRSIRSVAGRRRRG